MHPVFFSVSNSDLASAEALWEKFTSDLIYLFSRNGEAGVNMWDEIETSEIANCSTFVIFWSSNYARSAGCRREIAFAAQQIRLGRIRSAVIIKLDDYPLNASQEVLDPDALEVYASLSEFVRRFRAIPPPFDIELARRVLSEHMSKATRVALPVLPRRESEEELLSSSRIGHRLFKPVVWVSGYNGVGRKTLVREVYRRIDPNSVGCEIPLSDYDSQVQFALRIESEVFTASEQELRNLLEEGKYTSLQEIAVLIDRCRDAGRYLVVDHRMLIEGRHGAPEWLMDIASRLQASNRPSMFIISQSPMRSELLNELATKVGGVHVPSLSLHEATELAWMTIRALASGTREWDECGVDRVVRASGGNPELITAIIRLLSRVPALQEIEPFIQKEATRFSENLSAFIDWAVHEVGDRVECLGALRLLLDINPCAIESMSEAMPSGVALESVLGPIQGVGLIEIAGAGLVRVPALFHRRLDIHLLQQDVIRWADQALGRIASMQSKVDDFDHGYIRIEAAISSGLQQVGANGVPDSLKAFVSSAHMFRNGVKAYGRRHYRDAHELLREAFEFRREFRPLARLELCRYFGLASVRAHSPTDVTRAAVELRRIPGGSDLMEYLFGFQCEMNSRWEDAIRHYDVAYAAAKRAKNKDREARVIRPLIGCILKSRYPDYSRSEELSIRALEINRTVFALMNYCRVLLRRSYDDDSLSEPERDQVWTRYEGLLVELDEHPGSSSAYAEVRSEEYERADDLPGAIEWMNDAIAADPRMENRIRRWELMVKSRDMRLLEEVVTESRYWLESPGERRSGAVYRARVLECFALARKARGWYEAGDVERYSSGLSSEERARVMSAVRRFKD